MSYSEVLRRFEAWVSRLPPSELDRPFFRVMGFNITPREALAHLRSLDDIGRALLSMLSRGEGQSSLPPRELRKLIADRVRRSRIVYMSLGTVGPLTPIQAASMIERGDPRADPIVEAEARLIAYLERGLLGR